MPKTYNPGPETDDIVARQLVKGRFASPDDVVRAAVQLLESDEADVDAVRARIDEAEQAYGRGEFTAYGNEEEFVADIKKLGVTQ